MILEKDENGKILLVDKNLTWTSFDVVKKIRIASGEKKVGHAGTLDPLATGLLIVCVGKKTKRINEFLSLDKTYVGTMVLGKTTPSIDLETPIESEKSIAHVTPALIAETAKQFQGELQQIPPIYSAVKKNGKKAYQLARQGEKVELEARKVCVKKLIITRIDLPEIDFYVECSKGFYVRSFVRDFGNVLKTGAYLNMLRRTKIGDYDVKDAGSIESTVSMFKQNESI